MSNNDLNRVSDFVEFLADRIEEAIEARQSVRKDAIKKVLQYHIYGAYADTPDHMIVLNVTNKRKPQNPIDTLIK